MQDKNPDKDSVAGQADETDRGKDAGSDQRERPAKPQDDKLLDDEMARPPSDRSPLT